MVHALDMVIVMQPDLEAAVQFYTTLGLKEIFHVPGAWAEFELNGIKIGLCPTTQPQQERRTGIVFRAADVRTVYDEHREAMQFVGEPVEKAHGIMVSVKDPGGNVIDLYQPTPEKLKNLVTGVAKKGCCGNADGCACKKKRCGGFVQA